MPEVYCESWDELPFRQKKIKFTMKSLPDIFHLQPLLKETYVFSFELIFLSS